MKALEEARAAKAIGGSLEASVAVAAPAETIAFLESFGPEIRFLFLTSGVELVAKGDAVEVEVKKADGTKCQRCWNYTTDVGADPNLPGACGRCAAAVRVILAGAR